MTRATKRRAPDAPALERSGDLVREAHAFYRRALSVLQSSRIEYLIGGAYAFERYTGIERHTCDFDVFVMPNDAKKVLDHFAARGYRTALTHPHWLGKIHQDRWYVDVIFGSGNGLVPVDRAWFDHARRGRVLGHAARLCPIEEMIWSKSFIMERERFDGADVAHLIQAGGRRIDWTRLLERFGPFSRVLLAHLILFGFIYPHQRDRIPAGLMGELIARLDPSPPGADRLPTCLGTLLSRSQYLPDLERGLRDGRLVYHTMSPGDVARWTAAAGEPTCRASRGRVSKAKRRSPAPRKRTKGSRSA